MDENKAGVIGLNQPGNVSTYSVAANRAHDLRRRRRKPAFLHLADLNQGFVVGTDTNAGIGFVEPQIGGPFFNTSFAGNFFLRRRDTRRARRQSQRRRCHCGRRREPDRYTRPGQPSNLIADAVLHKQPTRCLPTAERSSNNGGGNTILRLVSPNRAVLINAKTGKTKSTVAVAEGSTLSTTAADLAIIKTATVTQAAIGEQFFYNLTVKNNGPGLATGVVVTDSLPPTVTFAIG